MKKLFLTILMLLVFMATMAVPAKRGQWKTLTLADGSQVRAELVGDEFMHYWQAEDGFCYIRKAEHFERADLNAMQVVAMQKKQLRSMRHRTSEKKRKSESNPFVGKKKGLIILVQFTDKKFKAQNTKEFFMRMANERGFNEGDFVGSVRDYFFDQSYGLLDIEFDVAGPYTLKNNCAFYGQNDDNGNDKNPGKMVAEAVTAAAAEYDFTQYDWGGDNEVDQVYVLYAGQGEANGGSEDTIWPHEWSLQSATGSPMNVQNMRVNTYACGSELGGSENITSGIGTLCHEYTHCLGIPDMYDTSSNRNKNYGMGSWDVMCSGSYNGNGFCPAGYTSYERSYCGWMELKELSEDTSVSHLKSLTDSGEAYIIYNDNQRNEFFLLECRNQTKWDAETKGKGLLIVHVDYDEDIWRWNAVNSFKSYYDSQYNVFTNDHQRCTIVPADNTSGTSNESGDPFPYNQNKAFSNVSTPSATLYNANAEGTLFLNKSVKNITRNDDGTVSFDFIAIDESTTNVLEGTLFYESFNECAGQGGNDNIWTASSSMFQPDCTGWEYDRGTAFGGNQCARFGSAVAKGTVTTPNFDVGDEAELTFKAAPWNKENTTMTISVRNSATTSVEPSKFTLSNGQWTECKATIKGAGNIKLVFSPASNRFFLDEVRVEAIGNESGISSVTNSNRNPDQRIYDLKGRFVGTDINALKSGLYIQNGKKVMK